MFAFIAMILFIAHAFAGDLYSSETGVAGKQILDTKVCDPVTKPTCVLIINNTDYALQVGTSFVGGGTPTAFFRRSGEIQCVLVGSPKSSRCISVLAPGDRGWMQFPSGNSVTFTLTAWKAVGLNESITKIVPGLAEPARVLGNPTLTLEGALAGWVKSHSFSLDLRGVRTVYAGMHLR